MKYKAILIFSFLLIAVQCSAPSTPELSNPFDPESESFIEEPVITTRAPGTITTNSAVSGGVFEREGGFPPERNGVCWSDEPMPDLEDNCTNDGNGFSDFTSEITGLSMTKTYFVRAYTITEQGVVYGDVKEFESDNRVSHGYVPGVSPSESSIFRERTYTTIRASWDGPGGEKVWLRMNLGATSEPNSASDPDADRNGWYFQFNRPQGYYQKDLQSPRLPSFWNNEISENGSWRSSNDPCRLTLGSSWRIPTEDEWRAFVRAPKESGGMGDGGKEDAFDSGLKLGGSGRIFYFDGMIDSRGKSGYYWTADQGNLAKGVRLYINERESIFDIKSWKAAGLTIRCILDD